MTNFTLDLRPFLQLTDEQFFHLCQINRDIQIERNKKGELIIMPPTGGETGDKNDEISFQLRAWNKQAGLGKTFNSSTGFRLPNGGVREAWALPIRSPDASWVQLERWEALDPKERQTFPPLCPDFVIELRSLGDALKPLQEKMQEYLDSGLRLGWLIDPKNQRVEIYRQGQKVLVLQSPIELSGEDVLPGFVLELKGIF